MSGIIAASNVDEQTVVFEAENITKFFSILYGAGSFSFRFDNGDSDSRYTPFETQAIGYVKEFETPYTGKVIISGTLNMLSNYNVSAQNTGGKISVNLIEYEKLRNLAETGSTTIEFYPYGDVIHLPRNSIKMYYLSGDIWGSLSDLPPNLKLFGVYINNTLKGNIKEIPLTVENIILQGSTTIDPIIFSDIPQNVRTLELAVRSFSIIDSLANLRSNIISLSIGGFANNNYITGDLSDISNIMNFSMNTNSLITGDLSVLNRGMTTFFINSGNEISGQISDIPKGVTYFVCYGSNTIAGNVIDIDLPAQTFQLKGLNSITGTIANIPKYIEYIELWGDTTLSGNITDLSRSIAQFDVRGNNTITGDLANYPKSGQSIQIGGNNTLYGDLANCTDKLLIYLTGNMSCTYSSSDWGNMYQFIYIPTTTGLTTSEIDQLLVDLSAAEWSVYNRIDIRGANAPRTPTSDIAVALLQSKGVTVLTN